MEDSLSHPFGSLFFTECEEMLGRETLGLEILLLLQTNPANKSKEEMNDFKKSAL